MFVLLLAMAGILLVWNILYFVVLKCQQLAGSLEQIDAGLGMLVGVNSNDNIYILFGGTWVQLPGALQHVTVGPAGLWGVNSANQIYKMVNGNWVHVPGWLQQIDAGGDQFVAGVNMYNDIYCRGGMAHGNYKQSITCSMGTPDRRPHVLLLWPH
ncbi:FEL protein, partial [Polypterus senegalus]